MTASAHRRPPPRRRPPDRTHAPNPIGPALAALVAVAIVVAALVAVDLGGRAAEPSMPSAAARAAVAPPPTPTQGVTPSQLSIPVIGVSQPTLVPLGLLPTGELEAPPDYDHAGWFTGSAVPGDPGPAVIAGHVDSRTGPAVFYRLRELRPGDRIVVGRTDGHSVTFTVDATARYPKDAFPTTAVYGPVPGSALRLITCGGAFDAQARSYIDNIVVYASLR